jgi:tetratricopeptide (TPR) repeat protein
MKDLETLDEVTFSEHENEIDTILRDIDKHSFIASLEKVSSEYQDAEKQENKSRKISRNIYYYAAAAIIIVCIGVGSIIKFSLFNTEINSESIFSEYYQTYQNDFLSRSDESVVNNLYQAFQAYENEDFDKAVELFSKVSEVDASIIMAYFYKGISCIEISDYKQAIESFNKVLANANNPYFPQSHWYCALTWLKLNNTGLAKEHLEWLVKNDRFYNQKAKEILKKI